MTVIQKSRQHILHLTMGGLFIALFAVVSNIPFLAAVQLIPGVPITLQVFLVAFMALIMGLRASLLTLTSLLLLTLCGLPMMSGGKGGLAALAGATSGYIYGWYLIVLLLGLYHDYAMSACLRRRVLGIPLHIPAAFATGLAGVLLDYVLGTLGVLLVGGTPISAFGASYIAGLSFLPADCIKLLGAALLSLLLLNIPRLRALRPEPPRKEE